MRGGGRNLPFAKWQVRSCNDNQPHLPCLLVHVYWREGGRGCPVRCWNWGVGVAGLEPIGSGCRIHERKQHHEEHYHIGRDSGSGVVIPPKANRIIQRLCDFTLTCERNLVERFFNKIKHCRAVATRYAKRKRNYIAFLTLVSVMLWLK